MRFSTAYVYTELPDGSLLNMGRKKIVLNPYKAKRAVLAQDGRPLRLIDGKWIYRRCEELDILETIKRDPNMLPAFPIFCFSCGEWEDCIRNVGKRRGKDYAELETVISLIRRLFHKWYREAFEALGGIKLDA